MVSACLQSFDVLRRTVKRGSLKMMLMNTTAHRSHNYYVIQYTSNGVQVDP